VELTADYCREIETYLCQKNDGHLIRVVGPSFELVSGWADRGVPIKVAFRGIDRYFERYYRRGPRRRPVRIDFCEADVLDVFDEWRRAVGVSTHATRDPQGLDRAVSSGPKRHAASLVDHLERVVIRLTNARATGTLTADADALIDRIAGELDAARGRSSGLRGKARQQLLSRLAAADAELVAAVLGRLSVSEHRDLDEAADEELEGFRTSLAAEAYVRAHDAAVARLVRERMNLPTIAFD
jgi:hypothetical protein